MPPLHPLDVDRRSALVALGLMLGAPRILRAQPRQTGLLHVFGKPPEAPARVFVAGPPSAALLTSLAPERLIGWPMMLSDAAKALLPAAVRDKPVVGRLAGRGSTVSMEALLAQRPDLVLDAGTVDSTYLSAAQRVHEQTGLPFVLVDGRLADTAAQFRQVGQLLGTVVRAQQLAAHAEETLALAQSASTAGAAGAAGSSRPGVYLARGNDGLETAVAGSLNAEIIEAAGGRNVAVVGSGGVARVSMEQLLGWAPDWVLTQDRQFHRLAQTDPVWRTLPAVRQGRLLLAPNLPFGWLDGPPGVNRIAGVGWLARCLRAGTANDPRTMDEALRHLALFYGASPSREAVQGWLDGRG